MNTTYEKIEAIVTELSQENFRDEYKKANAELINIFSNYIDKALVTCIIYGKGAVTESNGATFADLIISVDFSGDIKRFSLNHVITHAKFATFMNPEITKVYNKAWEVYTELTKQFRAFEDQEQRINLEAEKKAEAEEKAEAKYQKAKARSIRDFESLVGRPRSATTQADEFYQALGWLASHVGTVTAVLPDYLSDTFKKHFGDIPHTTVDGRKRTTNGNAMQWTFSFKATLRKPENVPAFLTQYLGSNGKAITDTSFIWDLVDTYGFQFGKKQDVEKIKETIPSQYIVYFEEGQNS